MVKLEIVSSVAMANGEEIFNGWLLDASAERTNVEFRVDSPWGYKLVEVEDFRLTQEMHPDGDQFRFAGRLGRFGLTGYYLTLMEQGEIEVEASQEDEVELLPLFKKNQMMTPEEFMLGYPGMMDPSED